MADFKTILALTKEADLRDQNYLDQIKTDLIILIDAANLADTEYKVVYDITGVTGGLGSLQQERIKLKLVKRLRDLSYVANFDGSTTITIVWTIAGLSTAL